MKLKIFVIFDSKANAYLRPFFMPEIGQACRVFSDMANDVEHDIGKHPADYSLFHIAQFDDATASIMSKETREILGNGLEYVKQPHFEDPALKE